MLLSLYANDDDGDNGQDGEDVADRVGLVRQSEHVAARDVHVEARVLDVFSAFSLLTLDPGITIETGDTDYDPCVFVSKACPDALAIVMPRRDTAVDSAALRDRYRAVKQKIKAA